MFKQALFSILIIVQLLITGCSNSDDSLKSLKMNKLALHLAVREKEFALNESVIVEAVLRNQSNDTVLINNRFLIGYEKGEEREIYFRIFSKKGKRYDYFENQADILPVALTQKNMQYLAPGESIKKDIVFGLVYPFKDPGEYRVVGVYESKSFEGKTDVSQPPIYSDTLEIKIVKSIPTIEYKGSKMGKPPEMLNYFNLSWKNESNATVWCIIPNNRSASIDDSLTGLKTLVLGQDDKKHLFVELYGEEGHLTAIPVKAGERLELEYWKFTSPDTVKLLNGIIADEILIDGKNKLSDWLQKGNPLEVPAYLPEGYAELKKYEMPMPVNVSFVR